MPHKFLAHFLLLLLQVLQALLQEIVALQDALHLLLVVLNQLLHQAVK